MSSTTLNTYKAAAEAAIASGDWATAETQLLLAKTELAMTPDSQGPGGLSMRWHSEQIDKLLELVRGKAVTSALTSGARATFTRGKALR